MARLTGVNFSRVNTVFWRWTAVMQYHTTFTICLGGRSVPTAWVLFPESCWPLETMTSHDNNDTGWHKVDPVCMLKYNREKMQPEVWYWTLVNLSSSVNVVLWLLDTAIFALLLQEEFYYDHASSRIGWKTRRLLQNASSPEGSSSNFGIIHIYTYLNKNNIWRHNLNLIHRNYSYKKEFLGPEAQKKEIPIFQTTSACRRLVVSWE